MNGKCDPAKEFHCLPKQDQCKPEYDSRRKVPEFSVEVFRFCQSHPASHDCIVFRYDTRDAEQDQKADGQEG